MKDQTTDQNPTPLFYLADLGIAPELCKEAGVPNADLPDAAYACPSLRLFPVHSKSATFQSLAYFHGLGYDDPRTSLRLKQAAVAYDILDLHDQVVQVFTSQTKQADAQAQLMALRVGEESDSRGFYPMNTDVEIDLSDESIRKDANEGRLPLPLARRACLALVKRAGEIGYDLQDLHRWTRDLGTPRLPDMESAASSIQLRRQALSGRKSAADLHTVDQAYQDLIDSCAQDVRDTPDWDDQLMLVEKYASLLYDLDQVAGVEYKNRIEHPYQAMFAGPTVDEWEKEAGETLFLDDQMVPVSAFRQVPDNVLSVRFSKDKAARLQQLKQASAYDINTQIGLMDDPDVQELLSLVLKHG